MATPRANGQVERYNRTILDALVASLEKVPEENKWDHHVNQVRWGLNNTLNRGIGMTPSELFLNYQPRNKVEAPLLNDIGGTTYNPDRDQVRKRAINVIKHRQQYMKKRYDLRRAPAKIFKCGDAVGVLKAATTNDGTSKKLLPRFAGPYEIKKVLSKDRYVVGDIKGCQRTQKPYTGVYPSEKLKPWESIISSDDDDEEEEDETIKMGVDKGTAGSMG